MTASFSFKVPQFCSHQSSLHSLHTRHGALTPSQLLQISNASLETHIGSVIILTADKEIIYATESLKNRLKELTETDDGESFGSQEIAFICQVLQQCRDCFPNQNWAMEFDVFTKDAIALRIRSRWLKLKGIDKPCILLVVEDRQQMIQDMVLDEAREWGLTAREQEVWLLHEEGCTYQRIAEKLHITINTVKKHMRSIYSKRKAQVA